MKYASVSCERSLRVDGVRFVIRGKDGCRRRGRRGEGEGEELGRGGSRYLLFTRSELSGGVRRGLMRLYFAGVEELGANPGIVGLYCGEVLIAGFGFSGLGAGEKGSFGEC